jgi:hypothetical protein
MIKIALILAIIGHILCGVCDALLTYTPNGKLGVKDAKDPVRMAELFKGTPLTNSLLSMVLGTLAITLFGFGYLAMSYWVKEYSALASNIMLISSVIFLVFIVVHHVICGIVEWLFIRMDLKPESLEAALDLQKKTIVTMFVGYAALLVFVLTLFVMIVSGKTSIPAWGCVFNTAVFMLPLAATKLPAKGNIAGSLMFIGLLILI